MLKSLKAARWKGPVPTKAIPLFRRVITDIASDHD